MIVFFFKQKTAYEIYQCDWSSDVCSSDLALATTNQPRSEAQVKVIASPIFNLFILSLSCVLRKIEYLSGPIWPQILRQ